MLLLRGETVTWASNGMPGVVIDTCPDGSYLLIEWEKGYKSDISGRTLWNPSAWESAGLIVRQNGHATEPEKVAPLFAQRVVMEFR